MPQDAVQRARSKIILRMPGNGHTTGLSGVFILPMAALLGNHDPTVIFNYTQNFSNSHYSSFLGLFSGILVDSERTHDVSGDDGLMAPF